MGEHTGVAWCHHTFNGWWGCVKVSRACKFCYAEAFAKRTGFDVWGATAPRRFFGDAHFNEPLRWNRKAAEAGEHRRVFCGSMSDIGELHQDLDTHRHMTAARAKIFGDLVPRTPWLTWMFTSKRIELLAELLPAAWFGRLGWPPNVWILATVEDQAGLARARALLEFPAPVRALSMEPLVERLTVASLLRTPAEFAQLGAERAVDVPDYNLARRQHIIATFRFLQDRGRHGAADRKLDWLIVGGESGVGRASAPLHPAWVGSVIAQAEAAGTPVFFKQWGQYAPAHWPDGIATHEVDGAGVARELTHVERWRLDRNIPIEVPSTSALMRFHATKEEAGHLFQGREYRAFPSVAA